MLKINTLGHKSMLKIENLMLGFSVQEKFGLGLGLGLLLQAL